MESIILHLVIDIDVAGIKIEKIIQAVLTNCSCHSIPSIGDFILDISSIGDFILETSSIGCFVLDIPSIGVSILELLPVVGSFGLTLVAILS